ncbi:MAG: DUF262 domain-containing protein [Bacteroidales bacterium]|jgi:hypothetical protein|nr:DUF262 domain-containing protein [Bacteroidales bacterium]
MAENAIKLKSVSELLGMKFFIPSYQRGYRWTEQQVKDLLNDVNEFHPETVKDTNEKTWYCLQPLVVSKMNTERKKECQLEENEEWYEVIDGQQRLTTIFIILNLIDSESALSLKYQTRAGSETFLQKIKNDDQNAENIDYHFMIGAKKTIKEWTGDKLNLAKKLKENCKVIWYETQDNAYEVFKRLNSGKISLSNAELVKALLLKDDNFNGLNSDAQRLKQLEMAGEWDRMEQALHENSFWYFINPEPEDARFNCTRIDFLLEMVLRCEKNDKNEFSYDIQNELKQNDYFIFSTYSEHIVKEGWEKQWSNIQRFFRIMKSWYDNRLLYHYVGYLMNLKGENKMTMLRDLLCEADKPKDEFLSSLIKRCQQSIGIGVKQKDGKEITLKHFSDWEYNKNNNEIHNVLLLFNLATTQNQISEVSRYPFNKHFEAAKKKWSLEHIHAQNEKKANWDESQFNTIKGYLKKISVDGIEDLNIFLEGKNTSENIDDNTYKAIMGAFMGKPIHKNDNNGIVTFSSDFEKDDHLTNMALLQGDKNASFNNKLYPEKRAKLAEYENVEKESLFVPICTRNVFFKHYSPNSTNPLLWDEQAGKEYVTAMTKVVAAYLKLEPILPNENKEFQYGIKLKGEQK